MYFGTLADPSGLAMPFSRINHAARPDSADIDPETGKAYFIGLSESEYHGSFKERIILSGWQGTMREADLSVQPYLALNNTTGQWESIEEILQNIIEEKDKLQASGYSQAGIANP